MGRRRIRKSLANSHRLALSTLYKINKRNINKFCIILTTIFILVQNESFATE